MIGLAGAFLLPAVLHAQISGDPGIRSTEQTLAAVLQWEILWNDSPTGFRLPSDGVLAVAIDAARDSVSYCSHQAGVCATYRKPYNRNWEGTGQARCDDNRSDLESVLAFTQKPGAPERDFSGFPAPDSGVTWTTTITVGSRAEIVMKYQHMHPAGMDDLEKWLRSPMAGGSALKSITIACFAATDPTVYYYVDRPTEGPVERPSAAPTIMVVFWRLDQPKEWEVAGYSQRWQNPEKFDEMLGTIQSVACSTVRFK